MFAQRRFQKPLFFIMYTLFVCGGWGELIQRSIPLSMLLILEFTFVFQSFSSLLLNQRMRRKSNIENNFIIANAYIVVKVL